MRRSRLLFGAGALVLVAGVAGPAWAKGKPKRVLPDYVLTAHTVAVLVDPEAGVSIEDPRANQVAQKDVESALTEWGRYLPILSTGQADLIIVVRRGHGKLADVTIRDPRQNDRPGAVTTSDSSIGPAAQHGNGPVENQGRPQPQADVGGADDDFEVYQGNVANPLDGPAVWRWVRKDGLHPHDVPAVDEFRKAVAETEKAIAAAQQGKKP